MKDENYDSVPGSLERGGVLPWGAPKERVRWASGFNYLIFYHFLSRKFGRLHAKYANSRSIVSGAIAIHFKSVKTILTLRLPGFFYQ